MRHKNEGYGMRKQFNEVRLNLGVQINAKMQKHGNTIAIVVVTVITLVAFISISCVSIDESVPKYPPLSNDNLVVIATTMPTLIGNKRRNNLVSEFGKYNIDIHLLHGLNASGFPRREVAANITLTMFQSFETDFAADHIEYGLIVDDDFFPKSNFLDELKQTVDLLPNGWRSLHLAVGGLYGRHAHEHDGHLNPEPRINVSHFQSHESGRFFTNVSAEIYFKEGLWLGGPMAVLVNKHTIAKLIKQYTTKQNDPHLRRHEANDVLLVMCLTENDFICRDPMLGWEEMEGGTQYQGQ